MDLRIQKKLNKYFECEQDFTQPFWQDPNVLKIYKKCMKAEIDYLTADAYVEIYRASDKVLDIRTFHRILENFETEGYDVFSMDKEKENDEYLYLKKLLKL